MLFKHKTTIDEKKYDVESRPFYQEKKLNFRRVSSDWKTEDGIQDWLNHKR